MKSIKAKPLTAEAFAPFGDVLELTGDADKIINQGFCGRWHDKAELDFGPNGQAGISLFNAQPRSLPYTLEMVECHPEGSQAFVPMHQNPWLVVVADQGDEPGTVHAFIAGAGQGVNFHRGTWHGVLCPLHDPGLFAVVDRIGETANLKEFWFKEPYVVVA